MFNSLANRGIKSILLTLFFTSLGLSLIAQKGSKPSIMVVPNDGWCRDHGYFFEVKDSVSGGIREFIDYQRATADQDLIAAIAKINEIFAVRGFPLKDMETALKQLEKEKLEQRAIQNKGARINISGYDELAQMVDADIILELHYSVSRIGPEKRVTFIVKALDPYSRLQIGGASGTSEPVARASIPQMLQKAVLEKIETLQGSLQDHFDRVVENGRPIRLQVQLWENASFNFEDYCGADTYEELVVNWVYENCKAEKGNFIQEVTITESLITLENVLIDLYQEMVETIMHVTSAEN